MSNTYPETTHVVPFRTPTEYFGSDPHIAGILAQAADLVFILRKDGLILDMSARLTNLPANFISECIGRNVRECVAEDSKEKVSALLRQSSEENAAHKREINFLFADRVAPFSVSVSDANAEDRIFFLAQDLSAVSALQSSLAETQLSYERERNRIRQTEAKQRLLFQTARDALIIVDADSDHIIDHNEKAATLFDSVFKSGLPRQLVGALVCEDYREAMRSLLVNATATGKQYSEQLILPDGQSTALFQVTAYREGRNLYYLISVVEGQAEALSVKPEAAHQSAISLLENHPDALVFVDRDMRVVSANSAFLNLCEVPTETAIIGDRLESYLGRSSVDTNILSKAMREHGLVSRFSSILRGKRGGRSEIEVSGITISAKEGLLYGLIAREIGKSQQSVAGNDNASFEGSSLASQEGFADLVGRVPLKDLVRDATDLVEKRCIEAALNITKGNRASASEMLGLSRQSLYVKLHRFGLMKSDNQSPDMME